jgi:fumarate hydratase class II
MITREQIENALTDDRDSVFKQDEDHGMKVVTLLRNKIPYSECHSILVGASHDQIYLPDIGMIIKYIDESDLSVLVDCNSFIDEDNDCLSLYV